MKITIKKLNHLPSLSEETYCFSAYVYADNKVIGKASNNGIGGSTNFYANEHGNDLVFDLHDLIDKIDDAVHAKISEASQAKELRKIKKHMLKAVLFLNDVSEGLHSYRYVELKGRPVLTGEQYLKLLDGVQKKYPIAIILNGKTDEELLELLAV